MNMFLSAVASGTVKEAVEIKTLGDSLKMFGIGFGMVFAVLLVLMAFIGIMSACLKAGAKAEPKTEKQTATVAPAVQAPAVKKTVVEKAAPVAVAGDMSVTVNGKKKSVSVVEKMPEFTVTINGKKKAIDVESVEEAAE